MKPNLISRAVNGRSASTNDNPLPASDRGQLSVFDVAWPSTVAVLVESESDDDNECGTEVVGRECAGVKGRVGEGMPAERGRAV